MECYSSRACVQKIQTLSEERQQILFFRKFQKNVGFKLLFRNFQKLSETFRNCKKLSEALRNFQKLSETFRNSQKLSEKFRKIQKNIKKSRPRLSKSAPTSIRRA